MKIIYFINCCLLFSFSTAAQNVGIGTTNPVERLQVDSVIKIGKNQLIGIASPGRKNLLKFGDSNFVSIGEEVLDDKLYFRSGEVTFIKSPGSRGSGYIGIQTEAPTTHLDINGGLRLRPDAAAGKILTSDATGNATWQAPASLPVTGFRAVLVANKFITSAQQVIKPMTEEFDDGGNNFDPATGIYTVPSDGVYNFELNMVWDAPPVPNNNVYLTVLYRRRLDVTTPLVEIADDAVPSTSIHPIFRLSHMGKFIAGDQVYSMVSMFNGVANLQAMNSYFTTSFTGFKVN